jgi:hypothetical protein
MFKKRFCQRCRRRPDVTCPITKLALYEGKVGAPTCFCLRPVSEADAEGLGTTICQLFDNFLQLFDYFLTTFWQLFFLFGQLFDYFFFTF